MRFKVLKTFQDPLSRLATESVLIDMMGTMNSKSEFRNNKISRIVVEDPRKKVAKQDDTDEEAHLVKKIDELRVKCNVDNETRNERKKEPLGEKRIAPKAPMKSTQMKRKESNLQVDENAKKRKIGNAKERIEAPLPGNENDGQAAKNSGQITLLNNWSLRKNAQRKRKEVKRKNKVAAKGNVTGGVKMKQTSILNCFRSYSNYNPVISVVANKLNDNKCGNEANPVACYRSNIEVMPSSSSAEEVGEQKRLQLLWVKGRNSSRLEGRRRRKRVCSTE